VRGEPGAAPGSHAIEFTVRALGVEGMEVRESTAFLVR